MPEPALAPPADVLHDLVAPVVDDLQGEQRRRVERAAADLRTCLERTAGGRGALPPGLAVLRALPCFLEEPEWRGADVEDRRVRMRLALELARRIRLLRDAEGVDLFAASVDLDRAWRSALRQLREVPAER